MSIVVFSFYGDLGARVLEGLLAQGEEVLGVVARLDPRRPDYEPPIARAAFSRYVPVYRPADVNDPAFVEAMRRLRPDYIVSMYSGRLFREPLLAVPRVGCVNMHNSLLPRWRGQAPSTWGLIYGDAEAGQTIHWLDAGTDSGDIIFQRSIPIEPTDTGGTLGQKLIDMGVGFFLEKWPEIRSGRAPRVRQDDALATYCAAPRKRDYVVDWGWPAVRVHNHVRGFGPPGEGAVTHFLGRRVRLLRTEVADAPPARGDSGVPGQVIAATGDGIVVRTGDGSVAIREARYEDDGSSFLAGPSLGPWCVLGRGGLPGASGVLGNH